MGKNMNFEADFVADFLSPAFRERILYELSSPKKIDKALERFSHNVEAVIRKEYVCYKGINIDEKTKLQIKNCATECSVLSFRYRQGIRMSIEEAFEYLTAEYNFAMIIASSWLILKPEHEGGQALYYVLKK